MYFKTVWLEYTIWLEIFLLGHIKRTQTVSKNTCSKKIFIVVYKFLLHTMSQSLASVLFSSCLPLFPDHRCIKTTWPDDDKHNVRSLTLQSLRPRTLKIFPLQSFFFVTQTKLCAICLRADHNPQIREIL